MVTSTPSLRCRSQLPAQRTRLVLDLVIGSSYPANAVTGVAVRRKLRATGNLGPRARSTMSQPENQLPNRSAANAGSTPKNNDVSGRPRPSSRCPPSALPFLRTTMPAPTRNPNHGAAAKPQPALVASPGTFHAVTASPATTALTQAEVNHRVPPAGLPLLLPRRLTSSTASRRAAPLARPEHLL